MIDEVAAPVEGDPPTAEESLKYAQDKSDAYQREVDRVFKELSSACQSLLLTRQMDLEKVVDGLSGARNMREAAATGAFLARMKALDKTLRRAQYEMDLAQIRIDYNRVKEALYRDALIDYVSLSGDCVKTGVEAGTALAPFAVIPAVGEAVIAVGAAGGCAYEVGLNVVGSYEDIDK